LGINYSSAQTPVKVKKIISGIFYAAFDPILIIYLPVGLGIQTEFSLANFNV